MTNTKEIITISCPEIEETLRKIRRELYAYRKAYAKTEVENKRLRSINMEVLTVYQNLFGEKALREEREESE